VSCAYFFLQKTMQVIQLLLVRKWLPSFQLILNRALLEYARKHEIPIVCHWQFVALQCQFCISELELDPALVVPIAYALREPAFYNWAVRRFECPDNVVARAACLAPKSIKLPKTRAWDFPALVELLTVGQTLTQDPPALDVPALLALLRVGRTDALKYASAKVAATALAELPFDNDLVDRFCTLFDLALEELAIQAHEHGRLDLFSAALELKPWMPRRNSGIAWMRAHGLDSPLVAGETILGLTLCRPNCQA
jgi:hypothetical protein